MSDDFGITVAKYREKKEWSQEDLSYESGMSRNTIQRIEKDSI